jgi:hypothetical protein
MLNLNYLQIGLMHMVFFLFTFEYVEFVCCLLLNNYMINASESFDKMNLNMKSMGKHNYI